MGSSAKLEIDRKIYKKSKEEIKNREKCVPKYNSQNFIPPKGLSATEKKIWNELTEIFKATKGGIVSDADLITIEHAVKAKAQYDKCDRALKRNDSFYVQIEDGTDKEGMVKYTLKENKNYSMRLKYGDQWLKYAKELGLTPQGRAQAGLTIYKNDKNKTEELDFLD